MQKLKIKMALPCEISRGGFSDEVVFKIHERGGDDYISSGSKRYFWDEKNEPIGEIDGDKWIKGQVAARVIQREGDHKVLVSIPDGEVIVVETARLLQRPPEVEAHVSLRP